MQRSFIWQKNTALHLDIYSLAKPACLPRAAWTRASERAPRASLAKGRRTAWQSLACSNAFPRRASLCSALPPGSVPPAAGRSLGGAAARADATGHAGPLLQPAGRCARAASAARRVAVIGHPALAPGARPLAIHSEVRS